MTKSELEKIKKEILEMRNIVLAQMENNNHKESLRDRSEDHSYSFHIAEQRSDANAQETSFMLKVKEGIILEELDEALNRIEEGSYGDCILCGEKINPKRLEAIPYAKLCLDCKVNEEM